MKKFLFDVKLPILNGRRANAQGPGEGRGRIESKSKVTVKVLQYCYGWNNIQTTEHNMIGCEGRAASLVWLEFIFF